MTSRATRLALILAVAALGTVAIGARAQTPSQTPAGPASGPSASPIVAARNAALLAKLLKLLPTYGRDGKAPPAIAGGLGLAPAGEAWADRQFAVQSSATGSVHAVAVGGAPDSDVLMSVRGPAAISVFRVRRDGTLAGALAFFPDTQLTMTLSPTQAADQFEAECAFWTINLESLLNKN